MYIFPNLKLLYIRVPATGSNSILVQNTIEKHEITTIVDYDGIQRPEKIKEGRTYTDVHMWEHFPAYVVKKLIKEKMWNEYTKIAFTRNPYTWMNSCYAKFRLKNIGMTKEELSPAPVNFEKFIRMNNKTPSYWYTDPDTNEIMVDKIYRLEDINNFFEEYDIEKIHNNIRGLKKPHMYSPDLIEIMQKRFEKDFEFYESNLPEWMEGN